MTVRRRGTMRTNQEVARARLADVPGDKVFWCHDGQKLSNLEELAAALREMPGDTFHHHVTSEKNDFSVWVREVMGDQTLAKYLETSSGAASAAQAVEKKVAWLKARA
jgi:hypothetical protein